MKLSVTGVAGKPKLEPKSVVALHRPLEDPKCKQEARCYSVLELWHSCGVFQSFWFMAHVEVFKILFFLAIMLSARRSLRSGCSAYRLLMLFVDPEEKNG